MRPLNPWQLLLSACLSLVVPAAWAETPLSLAEAVSLAIRQHPQLQAAEHQVAAARAREVQAAAWPNPNVVLGAEEAQFTNMAQGIYTVGVSQPLLIGGQREARVEAAQADTVVAQLAQVVLRRDLVAQVKEAYIQVLYESEGVRLASINRDSAKSVQVAMQRRFGVGEVPRLDVLRAEVEWSRAQREVVLAENQLQQAYDKLNLLLGRPAQAPLTVQDLPLPAAVSLPATSDLVAQALAARPELRQATATIARESLQRRLAQTGLWTGTEATLAAGAVSGQFGFSSTLSLPIPVYRQQGEIAEAEANRLRAEAQLKDLRNTITLEVEQAYRDATIDAQQVALYRSTYLPQAERLAELAQRRFQFGEGTALDVIDARRALSEVRTQYARTLLDYRQALTSLERATGRDLLPASAAL